MELDKKERIQRRDSNGELIYQPPEKDILYSTDELENILSELAGRKIPQEHRPNRRKSHWVKKQALELLGYTPPDTIRQVTPQFPHQLLADIHTVSPKNNLQIYGAFDIEAEISADWGTEKEYKFSDLRYVIVRQDADYTILGVRVASAKEIESWDNTGKETIKWQGNIPKNIRNSVKFKTGNSDPIFDTLGIEKSNRELIDKIIEKIKQKERNTSTLLAAQPPNPNLLLTIDEIGEQIRPLLGEQIPDEDERPRGQLFEKEVAKKIGYEFSETDLSADTGDFPDIRHQYLDTKLQDSNTIDLGKHHPDDGNVIDAKWTQSLSPREARYVVGLADKVKERYKITGIVVVSGDEFNEYFSVTDSTENNIQMSVPDFESIGDADVEVKSESDDQTSLDEF